MRFCTIPVTCGRTSATRYAVVRPGSWSVIAMARGASVITPTSGGGGGPPASLAQAVRNMAASIATVEQLLLFSIARSVRHHATQEVVELGEFFFLETIEMDVHAFDDDRPDFRGSLLAFR